MKSGEVIDVTLQPGQVLAVSCDANVSCKVVRLGDTPGLPASSPVAVAASATYKQGPFVTATRFEIRDLSGNGVVTYTMAAPPTLASMRIIQQSITPGAVGAANASGSEQTFTVTGVSANDVIAAVSHFPTGNACTVGAARVVGANQVAVCFDNPTAGSLTPAAGTYSFLLAH